jgi:hypothetical protein
MTTLSLRGVVAAGSSLVVALALPAAAANLIANGSFEAPVVPVGAFIDYGNGSTAIPGWTVVGPQVAVVSGQFREGVFGFPAQEGAQWLDLTGCCASALECVEQVVSTVAGTRYRLSFRVGNVSGAPFGSSSTVEVRINGVSVGQFTNNAPTQVQIWRQFLVPLVAQGSATTITFLNRDPSTETHNGLDNISLVSAQEGLALDFGSDHGTWLVSGTTWWRLHGQSPVGMVSGDLDGNGTDDLVLDFGPASGVWAWLNNTTWAPLHPLSPSLMVTGDLDGNGHDDIVFVFPGYGTWRWHDGGWVLIHQMDARRLAVGQFDGLAGDDLLVDFPGYGLYSLTNNATWRLWHTSHAINLVTADLDASGQDEAIIDFGPPHGIWVYQNNTTWVPLHGSSAVHIAAGDIDGSGRADLVVDFGASYGLWVYRNYTAWEPLHGFTAEALLLVDRDGTGTDEVLVDFGPGFGLWQYANDTSWDLVHPISPEALAAGRFD